MGAHGTLEEALANVSSYAAADAQNELVLKGSRDGKASRKSSAKKSSKKAHKAERKHEQSDKKKVLLCEHSPAAEHLLLSHAVPPATWVLPRSLQATVQRNRQSLARSAAAYYHSATYPLACNAGEGQQEGQARQAVKVQQAFQVAAGELARVGQRQRQAAAAATRAAASLRDASRKAGCKSSWPAPATRRAAHGSCCCSTPSSGATCARCFASAVPLGIRQLTDEFWS